MSLDSFKNLQNAFKNHIRGATISFQPFFVWAFKIGVDS